MADPREKIMARIVEVARTEFGVDRVFRNELGIPEDRRPAVLVLDADESVDETNFGKGRPNNSPLVVSLQPEIYVLAEDKQADIGATLNALRARLLKAVLEDAQIKALCQNVKYIGFSTSLAAGRSMEGAGSVGLTFDYVLRPAAL